MLLLLLSLTQAHATQVSVRTLACPTGNGTVKVYDKVTANTHGGWDSDLASYSTEGQFREYAVSTCPGDLFSLYGKDMATTTLTDEQKLAVEAKLAELRAQSPDPSALQLWDRYLIAAEMYKILGADHRTLYQLYMEASWAARDVAVGEYVGLQGPAAARGTLDQGRVELQRTDLDDRTRKILLHNLARVAHRGGFSAERDDYLDQFEAVGHLDADERKVLDTMRWITGKVEPALQALAVGEIEAFLAQQLDDETEMLRATYLLADIYRRHQRMDEALQGYAIVAISPNAPDELRELSAWFGANL